MKKITKLLVLMLVMALVLSVSACSLVSKDKDKDSAQIVATVNGVDITKQEVVNILRQDGLANFDSEAYYFLADNAEILAETKTLVLDYLIMQEVYKQKAETLGLDTFTAEENSDFEAEAEIYLESFRSEAEVTALEENLTGGLTKTQEELAEQIDALVNERLSLMNVTQDTFIDLVKEFEIQNRLYDYLAESIDVTEENVQSYYDDQLKNQEKAAVESPELFEMMLLGSVQVYDLNETYNVKHILVGTLEEDADLSEESRLLFSTATSPEEQAAAIVLMTPAFDNILPIVEEIQAKIAEGVDFDELIIEYGEDPGMASYPDGYEVVAGSGQFMPAFEDAAVALTEAGQVSEPVKTIYGYHILKLVKIVPAGAVPFDDIKAEIEYALLGNAQSLSITNAEAEWLEEATVERFDDALMN